MGDSQVSERPCSECGLSPRVRVVRRWRRRRVLLVQVGLVLLGVMWLGWRVLTNWPAERVIPASVAGVHGPAEFPARRSKAEDVERVAAGLLPGVDLLEGHFVRRYKFGHEHVEIAARFGPAKGSTGERRLVGWPAAWRLYRYNSTAEDVYTREGEIPATSPLMGQTMWSGRSLVRHEVEGSRRVVTSFVPEAFGGVALVLFVGWQAGRGLGWVTRPVFTGLRRRWAAAMPWLGVAVAGVVVVWLSGGLTEPPFLMPNPLVHDAKPIGLRFGEIDSSAGSQQRLARAILDSVGDERDGVLMIGVVGRSDVTSSEWRLQTWPGLSMTKIGYASPGRGDFAGFDWDLTHATAFRQRTVNGGTIVEQWSMPARNLLNLVLGAVVLWQLPVFAAFVSRKVAERRGRRRLARGLCVNCGYPAGVAPS